MIGREGSTTLSKAITTAILDFFRVSICSALIGYGFALLSSYVLKNIRIDNKHRVLIMALFITTIYIPFFVSEWLGLSGIVTILFTGIASRRYMSRNIDEISRRVVSFEFRLLSYISETVAFLSMGMSIASESLPTVMAIRTLAITIALIILTRAFSVYPLLSWANICRRLTRKHVLSYSNIKTNVEEDSESQTHISYDDTQSYKESEDEYSNLQNSSNSNNNDNKSLLIPWNYKHIIVYAGLRGAISFQLAKLYPNTLGNADLIVFLTTGVIVFTIFFQGLFTSSLLECLKVEQGIDVKKLQDDMMKKSLSSDNLDTNSTSTSPLEWIEREIIYKTVVRHQEVSEDIAYEQEMITPAVEESSLGGTYALSDIFVKQSKPTQNQMSICPLPSPFQDFTATASAGSMMKNIFLDVDEEASVDISSLGSSSWYSKPKPKKKKNNSNHNVATNRSGTRVEYDEDCDDADDDTLSSSSASSYGIKFKGQAICHSTPSTKRSSTTSTSSIRMNEDVTISVARSRSFASSGLPMLSSSQSNFFPSKNGRK